MGLCTAFPDFSFRPRPACVLRKHLQKFLAALCSRLCVGKSLCNDTNTEANEDFLFKNSFPSQLSDGDYSHRLLSNARVRCRLGFRHDSCFFSRWLTHQRCYSRCFQVHYWLMQITSNYEATSAERMMSKWWWSVNKTARTEIIRNAR